MIDVDTAVNHALSLIPTAPGVPTSICDKVFMRPMEPASYLVKVPPGDPADVCGESLYIVLPSRGTAAIAAGDVGKPEVLVFKATGISILPKSVLIKKVGSETWTRFDPSKGVRDAKGSLVVQADGKLVKHSLPDRFAADMPRFDKQYAIEYWKSFLPPATTA